MKISWRAAWLSALLCASFTFVLHAAGISAAANPAVESAHAASVPVLPHAQSSTADNIFANGFEAAPVTAPQLMIVKMASSNFVVGVAASYTLKVTNTGTVATTAAATVSDAIPNGLTLGTLPAGCLSAGQVVTCTIASGLAETSSMTFVIPVTPTTAATPSVTNTATVTGGGDSSCPGGSNCSSTAGYLRDQ